MRLSFGAASVVCGLCIRPKRRPTRWILLSRPASVGLFGASTGAAAALVAAAKLPPSRLRGGVAWGAAGSCPRYPRRSLCANLVDRGGADFDVIQLNEHALARLRGPKALQIVPGTSHCWLNLERSRRSSSTRPQRAMISLKIT